MHLLLLLQEVTLPGDTTLSAVAPPEPASLVENFLDAGWITIPIVLLSIVAIAIFVERLITLRKAKANPEAVTERVRGFVHSGDVGGAIAFCEAQDTPITRILKVGLERLGRPIAEIEGAVQAAGRYEAFELEKRSDTLATIAGVAPMLGFLGTVTGMIQAFQEIQSLQGNVNPSVLAGGIWEALLTTALGLVVGIIALIFYNYLTSRINRIVNGMERSASGFIDLLQAPAPHPGRYEHTSY